jgi:predicted tellurium resistance membrane protein TerC
MGRALDANCARNRSRYRQRHLHFRPRRAARSGVEPPRPASRTSARTNPAYRVAVWAHSAGAAALSGRDHRRQRDFLARYHSDRRRPFPDPKATFEIHREIEGVAPTRKSSGADSLLFVIVQIGVIDLVFSIDSVITAIGMVSQIEVMIVAVLIAILVMYFASSAVSGFISRHPTTKTLAVAFLILIGVALVADGFDVHIPRGYIYFAMAFSAAVEAINIVVRQRRAGSDPRPN